MCWWSNDAGPGYAARLAEGFVVCALLTNSHYENLLMVGFVCSAATLPFREGSRSLPCSHLAISHFLGSISEFYSIKTQTIFKMNNFIYNDISISCFYNQYLILLVHTVVFNHFPFPCRAADRTWCFLPF